MKKDKDPNRLGFKAYFGTTAMSVNEALANSLMTSFFLMYLTDYSGIGALAASLGTGLLVFARIFDVVNDPIEGWIMDRAKPGKYGKYKPFIFLSIALISIGVAALFFIPSGMAGNSFAVCAWVIVGYLLYDIGSSFFAPRLVYRGMTLDPDKRGKLLIGPRLITMVVGMVLAALMAIINAVNAGVNNMHTAFGLTVLVMVIATAGISVLGTALVKEKYVAEPDDEEKIKLTDYFAMLKENDAMRCRMLSQLLTGFIWSFLFAAVMYYAKWAYCADLTTGAVDNDKFGTMSMIAGMMSFLPLIIGTAIAAPLMKLFKSPEKFHRVLLLIQCASCGLMFILQVTGLLARSYVIYFACVGLCAFAIGVDFMPDGVMNIECMDYDIYKNGKDRSALNNALTRLIEKAQSALSAAAIGILLTAVGYIVDSATDTYIGELSNIPSMLNGFIMIMGLLPCILGVVGYIIFRKYPINDEIRAKMKEKLGK